MVPVLLEDRLVLLPVKMDRNAKNPKTGPTVAVYPLPSGIGVYNPFLSVKASR